MTPTLEDFDYPVTLDDYIGALDKIGNSFEQKIHGASMGEGEVLSNSLGVRLVRGIKSDNIYDIADSFEKAYLDATSSLKPEEQLENSYQLEDETPVIV